MQKNVYVRRVLLAGYVWAVCAVLAHITSKAKQRVPSTVSQQHWALLTALFKWKNIPEMTEWGNRGNKTQAWLMTAEITLHVIEQGKKKHELAECDQNKYGSNEMPQANALHSYAPLFYAFPFWYFPPSLSQYVEHVGFFPWSSTDQSNSSMERPGASAKTRLWCFSSKSFLSEMY